MKWPKWVEERSPIQLFLMGMWGMMIGVSALPSAFVVTLLILVCEVPRRAAVHKAAAEAARTGVRP